MSTPAHAATTAPPPPAFDLRLQDRKKALEVLDSSCAGGLADSCNMLAKQLLRQDGKGPTPRDPPRARKLLEQGCAQNHGPSCYNLTVMYKNGDDGVSRCVDNGMFRAKFVMGAAVLRPKNWQYGVGRAGLPPRFLPSPPPVTENKEMSLHHQIFFLIHHRAFLSAWVTTCAIIGVRKGETIASGY